MNKLFVAVLLICFGFFGSESRAIEADPAVAEAEADLVAERVVSAPGHSDKHLRLSSEVRSLVPTITLLRQEIRTSAGALRETRGRSLDLQGALRRLNAEQTDTGTVINVPSSVLFAFDRYDLRSDASDSLDAVLQVIRASGARTAVSIEGYTDSIGTTEYNKVLSEKRARSVASWLESHGVKASRLQVVGRGESDAIATNDAADGRQRNRRVVITVHTKAHGKR